MRPRCTFALAAVLCLALGCSLHDSGESTRPASEEQAITDGVNDSGHTAVGMLVIADSPTCAVPPTSYCTATLVGRRTVLTAAHCIDATKTTIFCLGEQPFATEQLTAHPQWDKVNVVNDIALVKLTSAPAAIPAIIGRQAPTVGLAITLVGYGATSELLKKDSAGIKRVAVNTIASVSATTFRYENTGEGKGNVCYGDSGGPAFATLGGREVVIGVTSKGEVAPCGLWGQDTRVDAYVSWLDETSGGDLYDGGDLEAPQVTITAPTEGATLPSWVTISATASDNVGVTEVAVIVDGTRRASLTSSPFDFTLSVAPGQRTIVVTAKDKAGNEGSAQVRVVVVASDLGNGERVDAGVENDASGGYTLHGGCAFLGLVTPERPNVVLGLLVGGLSLAQRLARRRRR